MGHSNLQLRQVYRDLSNHLHFNVTAENWEQNVWLIEALETLKALINREDF